MAAAPWKRARSALFSASLAAPLLFTGAAAAASLAETSSGPAETGASGTPEDGPGGIGPQQAALAVPPGSPAKPPAPAAATDAQPSEPEPARRSPPGAAEICQLIAAEAAATGMSPDFFARLIWKESRFDIGAISPAGAQGIAQFMPYTAKERGLADPFDPGEAIRHSALYLKDLRAELGNWGLAAAAYNSGPNRVRSWLANGGSLPLETEDYVNSITFRPADWFREQGRELEPKPLNAEKPFAQSCPELPVMKTRAVFASVQSAPMRPWGVQVAGHFKESVAMKMYRRMQAEHPSILGGKDPIVVRERNGIGRKAIFAVRLGAESRSEADAICGELRSAGGACAVFKN